MNTITPNFVKPFLKVLIQNPFEILIALTITVLACCDIAIRTFAAENELALFPIYFLISNMFNQLIRNKKWKWIYWAISTLFICLLIFVKTPLNDTQLIVTFAITGIAYFSFQREKNNLQFAKNILQIVMNGAFAILIALVAYGLLVGIYSAVIYLFNIESINGFYAYLSSIVFLTFMPILFLRFMNNVDVENYKNKITELVFNYLLTPAMTIFVIIFYAYMAKIIINWELPKGNVALMVFGFGISALILKMISPIFRKSIYKKLYTWLPHIFSPALILFWVGTLYRIVEYGFTDNRVYLLLGGIFITLFTIMLMTKKFGHYFYAAVIMIILLFTFTYIPFISAEDIGERSQAKREIENREILKTNNFEL